MQEKPIYEFNNYADVGIDKVPAGSKILILDDGNGRPREVIKIAMGALTQASNIAEFLADTNLFINTGIQNNTTGTTAVCYQIWTGSAAEYVALAVYDDTVLYFIKE